MSNDNLYYAVGGSDGTIYIWETSRWQSPYQLKYNSSNITSVLFMKEDEYLISGDNKGRVTCWDYLTQKVLFTKIIKNVAIKNIINDGDGEGVVIHYKDGTFLLFNVEEEKTEVSDYTMEKSSSGVLADRNNNLLIYGNEKNKLVFRNLPYYTGSYLLNDSWIVPHLDIIKEIKFSKNTIQSIAISESNDLIALGTTNGTLIVYDILSGSECARIDISDTYAVQAITFFQNDILVGLADNTIHRIQYD